jgi:hypothetical protein
VEIAWCPQSNRCALSTAISLVIAAISMAIFGPVAVRAFTDS